jgi:hypothetical protein
MRRTLVVGLCGLLLGALAMAAALRAFSSREPQATPDAAVSESSAAPAAATDRPADDGRRVVEVDMKNVDLRMTGGIVVHVTALRGRFRPTRAQGAPFLDDNDSYSVEVDGGRMSMGMDSLNRLLNQRVLGKARSNVERVRASVDEDRLEQKGVMHKGLDLPFKTKGR